MAPLHDGQPLATVLHCGGSVDNPHGSWFGQEFASNINIECANHMYGGGQPRSTRLESPSPSPAVQSNCVRLIDSRLCA